MGKKISVFELETDMLGDSKAPQRGSGIMDGSTFFTLRAGLIQRIRMFTLRKRAEAELPKPGQ